MKARFFRWRTLRRIGIGLAILVGLLAILYLEMNRRARLAWEQCERELEELGEQLEGRAFIPPPVPDGQNFAMAPLFAPLNTYVKDPKSGTEVPHDAKAVDRLKGVNLSKLNARSDPAPSRSAWQLGKFVRAAEWERWATAAVKNGDSAPDGQAGGEILSALKKFSPELEEFALAAERPLARFPLQYEKGVAMPIHHTSVLIGFSGIFYLHSLAELEAGDSEAALRDLKAIERIEHALQIEPLLISHLVRLTVVDNIPQILWRGIIQHRWNEDQLKWIQQILSKIDLLADQQRVMRGERAFFNDYFDKLRRSRADLYSQAILATGIADERPRPLGWLVHLLPQSAILYHNQLWQNRWIQELMLPVIDAKAGRVYPRRQIAAEEIVKQTKPGLGNFIAKIVFPVYPSITMRTSAAHVSVREGEVACALERFRLNSGRYPESLRDLMPDYLAHPANDIFVDEPLHYRREPDGSYILYSVGWNGLDDHGEVVMKAGIDKRDDELGDWVWFGEPQK